MTKTRNTYIDLVKSILIFLVIWGHVIQFIFYKNSSLFLNDYIFKAIYIFHMPLFIGICGYFTYFSQKKTTKTFIKDRIYTTLLPMLVWCILLFGIESILNNTFSTSRLILLTQNTYWFIWAILFFSVIARFAKVLQIDKIFFWIISIIILTLISTDNFHYNWAKSIYPFFVLGYICAKYDITKIMVYTKKYAYIIFFVSVVCYFKWNEQYYIYINPSSIYTLKISLFRLIAGIFCSISFLLVLYFLYLKLFKEKVSYFFLFLGKETFSIYMIQTVFFALYANFINHEVNFQIPYSLASIFASVILLLFFSCIISCISKNKMTRAIFIGK